MLDQYQEIKPIGKYRNIWLVLDRNTGEWYVKKCLETFNRAAYERVAGIRNIHIPHIFAWRVDQGRLWLIEEYISGRTLEEWLNAGRLFSQEETVGIVRQVCEALACLHSQAPPVIHRDIKLSNIMIADNGIVKLIDYNAARLYERGLNQDTRLIGTEAYAAPEQFGFAQTDARTDIYSLGVVFNYLLTGEHINRRRAGGACGAIIKKCTQIDPDRRYQSVWELDMALQTIRANGFAKAASPGAKQIRTGPLRMGPARMEAPEMRVKAGRTADNAHGKKRIWPIPGFRSGVLWKKILALSGYMFIIYLCLELEPEADIGNPAALWSDRIIVLLSMLFTVAVYTDYHGLASKMPFLHHEKRWVRQFGYCMVWPFALGLLVVFRESAVLLIQAILNINI